MTGFSCNKDESKEEDPLAGCSHSGQGKNQGVAGDNPVKGWNLIPFENIMLTDIRYMCILDQIRGRKRLI